MKLPKDIDTKGHDFKWNPPAGMYDELYQCIECEEQVLESAEDTKRYLQLKVDECGECVGKVIKIETFRDDYNWLSNFARFEKAMTYEGLRFRTNEQFYQAMKVTDKELRETIANHPLKGLKKFCGNIPLRGDWEDIKQEVMLFGTRYKYSSSNPVLRQRLLDTGSMQIEEGNWWGDSFWGIDLKTGLGDNHLGRILMKVREEIRE